MCPPVCALWNRDAAHEAAALWAVSRGVGCNRLDLAHVANVRIVDKRFYSLSHAYDGSIFVALSSRDPFEIWMSGKRVRR